MTATTSFSRLVETRVRTWCYRCVLCGLDVEYANSDLELPRPKHDARDLIKAHLMEKHPIAVKGDDLNLKEWARAFVRPQDYKEDHANPRVMTVSCAYCDTVIMARGIDRGLLASIKMANHLRGFHAVTLLRRRAFGKGYGSTLEAPRNEG